MRGIAYKIPLPLARSQGTTGADRQACALMSAYASHKRGEALMGVLRGEPAAVAEAALLDALRDTYGVTRVQADLWADAINGARVGDRQVPKQLGGMTLEQYQVDAVAYMTPAGGNLALGCGLGKTLTACAYAHAIQACSVIVVCPLNAVPTWTKNKPLLPGAVTIQSMDSVHHLLGIQQVDLIIFDEAHLQGRHEAKRTKAAHQLRLRANAALTLTGTLLHAGIMKALSVLDLAIPGDALFSNRWSAGEHFHCLVRKSIGGRTVTELGQPPAKYADAFMEYLSRHTVALTPTSASVKAVLQLPGQDVYDIELGKPWLPLTQQVADYVHAQIAAGNPLPHAAEAMHMLMAAGAEDKADWVIANLGTDPAVIFAHYTATLDSMGQRLTDAGISFVRVDGSVTGPDRVNAQIAFQSGKVQVFLGQMSAAGISMDLYRSPYSIALDYPTKAADYAQALARTHRRGQVQACHHWDVYTNQLQKRVVEKLRRGDDFNSQAAEWQEVKNLLASNP